MRSADDVEKLSGDLGESTFRWLRHMPRHGLMWKETDFWGDIALDLPKEQLERPETCRCIHDCNFCREQRQLLKEEKPRLPTSQRSPYSAPPRTRRHSRRSQRDFWKHREKGYKAGDISLQRRYVEMHMPAHVVLHDDVRRSDAAIRELQELLIGQKRKKEAAKNASRPGTERRARERRRDREARQARRAQLARDSRRSPQLESASPDGSSAESEAFERAPEDVQAILRYRERRQSVLCERPPAAPEERERTHVDWKPVVTVSFQRSKETPSRPPEEEPPTESLSMENDLSSRARRLVFRQKQKSALDRSAIRADRRAHKEFASMLRDLARMQLIKEGDRIAEMVRLKDEKLIKEDFHRYDEDGNGMLQLTEIRGVLEDAGLLPQNDEEKASVRRTIVNMALQVPDGETDEEKELEEAKGNVLLVHQKQERLARDLELSREQMPELLERIRRRLKIAQQKAYFSHFTKYDLFDEGEMDIQDVLKLLQELKLLPDLDEARGDFARWLLTIVKGRSETNKVQSVASEDLASKKRAAVKSRMPRASTRSVTERPASRERPNSRERPSSKEGDEDLEDRDPPRPMSKGLRPAQTHHDKVDFLLEERERPDAVALEDLPRLLPDMKFDKFEFEVMADFLSEAHGRLTAQQQIELAEQLGLGKALFQEFRKELEAMIELFYSFDDTHSGVVKKVEVWVALSNLGLLPCLDQAPGRVTWEPPPLREESPSENEADTHLALSAASALVHDNEVLAEQLRASDAALSAVLAEVQSLRAQAAQLPMAQNQTKQLIACLSDASEQREELLRQRARKSTRIAELVSIMHDSLECFADVQREALVEAMATENHALWRMVKMAQTAASTPVRPAPVIRWPFISRRTGREARRRPPKEEVPSNAQSAPRAGAEQEPAVPAAAAAPAAPVLKMTPTEGGTAEKSERLQTALLAAEDLDDSDAGASVSTVEEPEKPTQIIDEV